MDRMTSSQIRLKLFVHKLDWINNLQIRLNNPIIYLTEQIIHKSEWMIWSQIRLNESFTNRTEPLIHKPDWTNHCQITNRINSLKKRKYFNFLKIIHFTSSLIKTKTKLNKTISILSKKHLIFVSVGGWFSSPWLSAYVVFYAFDPQNVTNWLETSYSAFELCLCDKIPIIPWVWTVVT